MTYTSRDFDLDEATDDELRPLLALANAADREAKPRSRDMSMDEFRAYARFPGRVDLRTLVHDERGRLAGFGAAQYEDDGSNPDVLRVVIRVAPEHRRHGVGTMLLRWAAGEARALGRTRIVTYHFDTVPSGAAFAEAIGAKTSLEMHMNVLEIADLDWDLMRDWATTGPVHAPGYSVRLFEGAWPEEILEGIAHLYFVIERDAPQAEGHQPRRWTVETVTELLNRFMPTFDSLMAMAVHEESGMAAGMSHLVRRHSDPSTWIVTTTMVDPVHRGKSLGKWVKAAANLAARERWDEGVYQETSNAFANAPMLSINHEMGFRHEFTATEVVASLDDVDRYLAGRD